MPANSLSPIVETFYSRVLEHPELSRFFSGTDMSLQIEKMSAAMTSVVNAQTTIDTRYLRNAHRGAVGLGMNDIHFDRVLSHLQFALRERGVDETTATEILGRIEVLRGTVLGRDSKTN